MSSPPGDAPWIVGRADTAPLSEIIAWLRHPYTATGNELTRQCIERLIAALNAQDAQRPSREQIEALRQRRFPGRDPESWNAGWDAAIDRVLALYAAQPVPSGTLITRLYAPNPSGEPAETTPQEPELTQCPACGHDHAPGRKCNAALKTPGFFCSCRSLRPRIAAWKLPAKE